MKNLSLILVISISFLSTGTFAADLTAKKIHPYVSFSLGYGGSRSSTTISEEYKEYPTQNSSSQNTQFNNYRISGGVLFNITPTFEMGPEIGYQFIGDAIYHSTLNGLPNNWWIYNRVTDFLVNNVYHFNHNWAGNLKLGVAKVSQSYKRDYMAGGTIDDFHENKSFFEAGLGLSYDATDNIGFDFNILSSFGGTPLQPFSVNESKYYNVSDVATVSIALHYIF
jgi:opacity protein-like surface antigen